MARILQKNKEYVVNILDLDRQGKKPRKDFISAGQILDNISYFFDECFSVPYSAHPAGRRHPTTGRSRDHGYGRSGLSGSGIRKEHVRSEDGNCVYPLYGLVKCSDSVCGSLNTRPGSFVRFEESSITTTFFFSKPA